MLTGYSKTTSGTRGWV